MTPIVGLVLGVSLVSLAISCLTALRNPPESLRRMAREAFDRSHQVQMANEAFKAEATAILTAVQDEAERASKLRARARSAQHRAEIAEQNTAPQTRDEILASLREKAGML